MMRPRLCLVTPTQLTLEIAATLRHALEAGDVASLLIDAAGADPVAVEAAIGGAVEHDVAAVIIGQDLIGNADGIHIEPVVGAIHAARPTMSKHKIVGVGGIATRHDAMTLGETQPDYLFFGRIDGDDQPAIHPRALELASWWAELFQIPAMVMGGGEIESATSAAANRIEFVAFRRAVWDHPKGPREAVKAVNRLLDEASA